MSKITIELVVTITGAEEWTVDWKDEWEASEHLSELRSDVKSAIAQHAGIDRQNIDVTSKIINP